VIGPVHVCVIGQVQPSVAAHAGVGAVDLIGQGDLFRLRGTVFGEFHAEGVSAALVLAGVEQQQLAVKGAQPGVEQSLVLGNGPDFAPAAVLPAADPNLPAALKGFAPGAPLGAVNRQGRGIQGLAGAGDDLHLLQTLFAVNAGFHGVVAMGVALVKQPQALFGGQGGGELCAFLINVRQDRSLGSEGNGFVHIALHSL